MAKTTTNYGLTKPEKSDNYNVDVMGNNMDKIDTKIKSIDNITNGGAIKSTSITNSGAITSTGVINANGGVKGNVTGSATSLNKTVTVGVSSTQFTNFVGNSPYVICPLVPGVVYTGKVSGESSWGGINVQIYKNGAWSSAGRIGNTGTSSSATGNVSFSGASIVMLTSNDGNSMKHKYFYLPTFTY